jgi:hypothetical protein
MGGQPGCTQPLSQRCGRWPLGPLVPRTAVAPERPGESADFTYRAATKLQLGGDWSPGHVAASAASGARSGGSFQYGRAGLPRAGAGGVVGDQRARRRPGAEALGPDAAAGRSRAAPTTRRVHCAAAGPWGPARASGARAAAHRQRPGRYRMKTALVIRVALRGWGAAEGRRLRPAPPSQLQDGECRSAGDWRLPTASQRVPR